MPEKIDELVAGNHILAREKVLDAYGHVSVRDTDNPDRYFLSRSLAPELVTAEDVLSLDVASSMPHTTDDRQLYLERFIHGSIYKARPDVNAVVHSHSPSVIPFGIVSSVPMKPVYHMSYFLGGGVPIYEIRHDAGMGDMMIGSVELGDAVARVLADKSVALMRGHGNVVVAASLPLAVYRAIYTEINARLQMQALSLGGPVNYLDAEEARKMERIIDVTIQRPWELWKRNAQMP